MNKHLGFSAKQIKTEENMTTENNKIIAEFMGIADEIETGATSLIQIEGTTGYYKNDNLQFHSDWNWLMKVVEKIESLGYSYSTHLSGDVRVVTFRSIIDYNSIRGSLKETTYNACLEFIKYYNEQTR